MFRYNDESSSFAILFSWKWGTTCYRFFHHIMLTLTVFVTCQIFTFKNVLTLHTYTVLIITTKSKVYYRTIRFWLKTWGTWKYQKQATEECLPTRFVKSFLLFQAPSVKMELRVYYQCLFYSCNHSVNAEVWWNISFKTTVLHVLDHINKVLALLI